MIKYNERGKYIVFSLSALFLYFCTVRNYEIIMFYHQKNSKSIILKLFKQLVCNLSLKMVMCKKNPENTIHQYVNGGYYLVLKL